MRPDASVFVDTGTSLRLLSTTRVPFGGRSRLAATSVDVVCVSPCRRRRRLAAVFDVALVYRRLPAALSTTRRLRSGSISSRGDLTDIDVASLSFVVVVAGGKMSRRAVDELRRLYALHRNRRDLFRSLLDTCLLIALVCLPSVGESFFTHPLPSFNSTYRTQCFTHALIYAIGWRRVRDSCALFFQKLQRICKFKLQIAMPA